MNSNRKILIGCLFLLAGVSAYGQLYRWVDASGQVHYSDTPRAGAEEITLQKTNTFRSTPQASAVDNEVARQQTVEDELLATEDDVFSGYESAVITSPSEGETLWNIGGVLNVSLRVTPALQRGHGIVFYYDGRPVNSRPVAATSVILEDVYRGSHSVRASIYSVTGDLLFNGATTQFQVMQSTAN